MEIVKSIKLAAVVSGLVLTACTPQSNQSVTAVSGNQTGIIGGVAVDKTDVIATSTVAIVGMVQNAKGEQFQFTCTGSLISDNVVLTAGHCIPEVPKGGKAGLFVVFNNDLNKLTQKDVRPVIDVVLHPEYALGGDEESAENDRVNQDAEVPAETKAQVAAVDAKEEKEEEIQNGNDIAVFKFQGKAPEGYKPAIILTNEALLTAGKTVTLAGFGINNGTTKENDNKLNKTTVEVIEHYGSEVVLDQGNGRGACHGDSGGPAFLEVDGTQYLWGITSRGIGKEGKDDCSLYAVYGKVHTQQKFIDAALKYLQSL